MYCLKFCYFDVNITEASKASHMFSDGTRIETVRIDCPVKIPLHTYINALVKMTMQHTLFSIVQLLLQDV
jgi:hypothetical protein